jgi:hypothetical protein
MTKRKVPQWVCRNPTGAFAVGHGSEARCRVVHGNHPIRVSRISGKCVWMGAERDGCAKTRVLAKVGEVGMKT